MWNLTQGTQCVVEKADIHLCVVCMVCVFMYIPYANGHNSSALKDICYIKCFIKLKMVSAAPKLMSRLHCTGTPGKGFCVLISIDGFLLRTSLGDGTGREPGFLVWWYAGLTAISAICVSQMASGRV